MQFEVDAVRLRSEAEAIEDNSRELNRISSMIMDTSEDIRAAGEESERISRVYAEQAERLTAAGRRLNALGRGLHKIAGIYRDDDVSAAGGSAENRWIVPKRDKKDPVIDMIPITEGIADTSDYSPEMINTGNIVTVDAEDIASVIRLKGTGND
jgi:hypothetical protein